MGSHTQPQSTTRLVLRAYSLNFRLLPTFIVLGLICFLVPVILLVLGSSALVTGSTVSGALMIVLGAASGLVGYAYCYATTMLLVWLRITGVKAGIFQVLRRLRGDVAWHTVATGFRVGLYIILGFFALIIPGLILYAKYMLAVPVVVMERVYGSDAMKRSNELSSGHRGQLVGALLLFSLINFIAAFVLGFVLAFLFLMVDRSEESLRASSAVAQLLSLLLLPASIIFPVLLYFDLRLRKEAWGVPPVRDLDTGIGVGAGI